MQVKYVYINTIGCQMNVYDAEQIADCLKPLGYKSAPLPEGADLIIVNTCTIREKAEQKAFSFLGRLAKLKRKKPRTIIAVGGCVAQQEGANILQRVPHVDLVFGTQAIARLPDMVERINAKRCRIVDIEATETIDEIASSALHQENVKVSSFVTIMRGCDNYCTYCVVPYVRGREKSRTPERIVQEIKQLVASGCCEVTLLGQNVNSYGRKEDLCSFPKLLAQVNQIKDVLRIRFTTSHPKDLSEDLICTFKELDKLCRHIHLPVQSGSDRVLNRMNRKYTRAAYLKKVDQLRTVCPDIAITSDFIVGFPGETWADFQETMQLIKQVEFDGLFAFKYSDRPNAPAARFKDKVAEQEKNMRLQALFELQEQLTLKKNQTLVGSIEPILIEGLSKKQNIGKMDKKRQRAQWSGRTSSNKIVNLMLHESDGAPLSDGQDILGKVIPVKIEKALSHSLWGRPVSVGHAIFDSQGGKHYAA